MGDATRTVFVADLWITVNAAVGKIRKKFSIRPKKRTFKLNFR